MYHKKSMYFINYEKRLFLDKSNFFKIGRLKKDTHPAVSNFFYSESGSKQTSHLQSVLLYKKVPPSLRKLLSSTHVLHHSS